MVEGRVEFRRQLGEELALGICCGQRDGEKGAAHGLLWFFGEQLSGHGRLTNPCDGDVCRSLVLLGCPDCTLVQLERVRGAPWRMEYTLP